VKLEGTGLLARIYVGESDQWHGRPLYEAIVHLLRDVVAMAHKRLAP
jgi:PII-like signaling protein